MYSFLVFKAFQILKVILCSFLYPVFQPVFQNRGSDIVFDIFKIEGLLCRIIGYHYIASFACKIYINRPEGLCGGKIQFLRLSFCSFGQDQLFVFCSLYIEFTFPVSEIFLPAV